MFPSVCSSRGVRRSAVSCHRLVAATALFTAVLLTVGCSSVDKIEAPLTNRPATDPLPLTVGIWYSPELRSYTADATSDSMVDRARFPVPATVATFDQAFSGLFHETVELTDPSPGAWKGGSLSAVLEIRQSEGRRVPSLGYYVVRYLLQLRSATGASIAAWSVEGAGVSPSLAVRDAAAALMMGFAEQQDVKRWLASVKLTQDRRARATDEKTDTASDIAQVHGRDGVVVLSRDRWTNFLAQCVETAMARTDRAPPVVPATAWRDALFPWFEPKREPEHVEDLVRILTIPVVRERISALGVRYVGWIAGLTTEGRLHGPYNPMLGGVGWWDKRSEARAELWDLVRVASLAPVEVEVKDTGVLLQYAFLFPLPMVPATETRSCHEMARKIVSLATTVTPDAPQSEPVASETIHH